MQLPGAKKRGGRPDRPAKQRRRQYRKRAKEWLKEHPVCAAWSAGIQCSPDATQIHHKRGRLGGLLLDERHWLGVCAQGHDAIHRHPDAARLLGLLCEKGKWNKS
jgi:hypothetical protein